MKNAMRIVPILITILAVVCRLSTSAPATEEAPLGDVDLGPSPPVVVLNLDNATINVTISEDRSPRLRWWKADPADPRDAELSPALDGGRIVVERPPTDENTPHSRLVLDLSLDFTSTGIAVSGNDLDLTVDNLNGIDEAPSLEPTTNTDQETVPSVDLQLSDSLVRLVGLRGATASLHDCLTETTNTLGTMDLEATGGELKIERHQGAIKIAEEQATVTIIDAEGTIQASAGQGSLLLRSIQSALNLKTNGAQIQIERLHGTASITATDSVIDLLDSSSTRLNINGATSYVTLSRTTATATFDLAGGSLTADDGSGSLNATCRESADLAVTNHTGDARLKLVENSRADLRRIQGALNAQVSSAELTIDAVQSFSFTADEARITGSGIAEIKKVKADRSEVDLDLTECTSNSLTLQAGEQSFVRIQLASPCRVRTKGIDASTSNHVRVTGCEYQLGQSRRWATRNVRGIDGNLPVTLVATMASSAELDVEGRP